jgi:hypothetical protein
MDTAPEITTGREPEAPPPPPAKRRNFTVDSWTAVALVIGLLLSAVAWALGWHLLDTWATILLIAVIMAIAATVGFLDEPLPIDAHRLVALLLAVLALSVTIAAVDGAALNQREAGARDRAAAPAKARAALLAGVRQEFLNQHFDLGGQHYQMEDLTLDDTGTSGTMQVFVRSPEPHTTQLVIRLVNGHWVAACEGQYGQLYPWDNQLAFEVQVSGSCAQALTPPSPSPTST